jgi:LmbE family N-acetylglucosaminyl deacetylase
VLGDFVMPDNLTRLVFELQTTGSPVLIVSPHLDDGIFSAGALLAHLAHYCPVTVLTVFTAAAPPPFWGLAARRQMHDLGVTDAEALFEDRRAEDISVLKGIGAAWVHLGLRDALFRRVGEAAMGPPGTGWQPTYPTFRFHAGRGRIAPSDAGLAAKVRVRVDEVVQARKTEVVFAPLGVGRHVDHLITRWAVQLLELPTVYYSDFPYSETAEPDNSFIRNKALAPHPWLSGRDENTSRMAGYKTQFPGLFPNGAPTRPEIYWISTKDSMTDA